MAKYQIIIGRNEFMSIVDTVPSVPAKVDTGAYRSAIHASNIKESVKNGKKVLTFDLLGHKVSPVKYPMSFDQYETVTITNSFGNEEKRFEVKLRVKIGPKVFNTSFTLADRSNNFFPVLLGRKCLSGRFIVDITKNGVDRMTLRKDYDIKSPMDEEDLE